MTVEYRGPSGQPVTELKWTRPAELVNGDPYVETMHGGYELGVEDANGDIQPSVAIPAAFDVQSWPLSNLPPLQSFGTHTISMRTARKNGLTSAWAPAITVQTIDMRVPNPPLDLAVA